MTTTITIDETLLDEALRVTRLKSRREAAERGLETLIRLRKQERIKDYRGKLKWEGDLDAMRRDA